MGNTKSPLLTPRPAESLGVDNRSDYDRLVGDRAIGEVIVDGVLVNCLIDTGSVASLMSYQFYKDQCSTVPLKSLVELCGPGQFGLESASGGALSLKGYVEIEIKVPGLSRPFLALFVVTVPIDTCPQVSDSHLLESRIY